MILNIVDLNWWEQEVVKIILVVSSKAKKKKKNTDIFGSAARYLFIFK